MRGSLWLIAWIVGTGFIPAQPAAESGRPAQSVPGVARFLSVTRQKSPIDFFRQLLATPPGEREQALAGQSESKRKVLQDKILEYERLSPSERELRLQLVELYYYLRPLMELPPARRTDKLAIIPPKDRALIEERLKQWDALQPDVQKAVLNNELTLQYFLRPESNTPTQREAILKTFPVGYRKSLEEKIEQWHAYPAESRQKMYRQFHVFFELPPKEKEKTLEALPEEERQQMEKSLETFAKLPSQQRQMYLDAFQKFADLTKEERMQFLKNVERWQEMSPRDRESWRNLVNLLPTQPHPPIPPPGGTRREPPSNVPLPGAQSPVVPPTPVPGSQGSK